MITLERCGVEGDYSTCCDYSFELRISPSFVIGNRGSWAFLKGGRDENNTCIWVLQPIEEIGDEGVEFSARMVYVIAHWYQSLEALNKVHTYMYTYFTKIFLTVFAFFFLTFYFIVSLLLCWNSFTLGNGYKALTLCSLDHRFPTLSRPTNCARHRQDIKEL